MILVGIVAATVVLAHGPAAGVPIPRPRPFGLGNREPLPQPRPRPATRPADEPARPDANLGAPSACRLRITPALAQIEPLPPLVGLGECGGDDIVLLKSVLTADARVAVTPPATLRCPMAEAVISWIRDEVAPAAAKLGAPLRAVANYASYECRGRNRVAGAPLSQHGRANALDVLALTLADGTVVKLADPAVAKDIREQLRQSACARFTTVLGPGSDAYHDDHVHLDLAERRHGTRLCQWDVR